MSSANVAVWASEENIELMKAWWLEGLSGAVIVDKFAAMGVTVTRNAIFGKVHRMGLIRHDSINHVIKPRAPRVYKPRVKGTIRYRNPITVEQDNREDVMSSNPNPTKRVLLRQIEDGRCKAIIGYLNGVIADAVCCGEDAPLVIKKGRVVHSSWCPHHHEIYTTKSIYDTNKRTA